MDYSDQSDQDDARKAFEENERRMLTAFGGPVAELDPRPGLPDRSHAWSAYSKDGSDPTVVYVDSYYYRYDAPEEVLSVRTWNQAESADINESILRAHLRSTAQNVGLGGDEAALTRDDTYGALQRRRDIARTEAKSASRANPASKESLHREEAVQKQQQSDIAVHERLHESIFNAEVLESDQALITVVYPARFKDFAGTSHTLRLSTY